MDKVKIRKLLELLDELYPYDGVCFLHYDTEKPWQLLFATILSAQCTDERVNGVTLALFEKYPELSDFAGADFDELCADIYSTGFFRMKAAHIIAAANILIDTHNAILPSDIELLTALPGVGRKTANVVRNHIFNIPSIVVDTHVKRISTRLGLTVSKDPTKIEFDLMRILPKTHWISINQQLITHGRRVCSAKKPDCKNCKIKTSGLCPEPRWGQPQTPPL
ncbi:MAG: endonuclease III [Turicibacter sp.]|nr:endonuclease III [Turicibacter sp.]